MKQNPAASSVDPSDEITRLVRTLHETQQRLKELTGGQVDAVLHQDGQSYLLHEAQGRLRDSEVSQRRQATTMLAILNALPAHICLLDTSGQIVSVNESWRMFALFNNWPDPERAVERNYLEICDRATGPGAEDAHRTAAGIRSVLSGGSKGFTHEYPCHTADKKLWFQVVVAPVGEDRPGGAVVMHVDITERKLAEEALQATTSSLATSQAIAHLGSWEIDLTHSNELALAPHSCSDEMYRILGYEPQSVPVSAEFFFSNIPPEYRAKVKDELSALISDRQEHTFVHPVTRPSGERRFIQSVAQVVVDNESGRLSKVVGTAQDITETHLAEEALRSTANSLAVSQSIAHLGSWEMELENLEDLRANPLAWSDEMYRIFGYLPQSIAVTPDFYLSHVLGDDQTLIEDRLKEVLRENREQCYQYPIVRADGEVRIVQTAAQVILRDQSGRPLKLFGTIHDVTEARKNEDLLLAETALLEAQLNSTLDGILVIDPDGKKILQNQRAVEIWKIPEEYAHERDHRRRFEWITSQIRNKEPFLEKVRHLYANPDLVDRDELELIDGRIIDRYSAPIRGQDGRHYGRIWVFRDITDRKVAEQKASEQIELMNMASQVGKLGAWSADYPGPKLKWSSELYSIYEVEPDFPLNEESGLSFFVPESRRRLEAAIESKKHFDLELEIVSGKGNRRWVRTTNAIDIKDGEVKRVYGVLQDITEQKKNESRTIPTYRA
jgi:PAS domain S-box-containing protein